MKMTLELPELFLERNRIDENTIFETFYEDGKIHINTLSEEDLKELAEQGEAFPVDPADEELSEACYSCPYFCEICGCCTYDD